MQNKRRKDPGKQDHDPNDGTMLLNQQDGPGNDSTFAPLALKTEPQNRVEVGRDEQNETRQGKKKSAKNLASIGCFQHLATVFAVAAHAMFAAMGLIAFTACRAFELKCGHDSLVRLTRLNLDLVSFCPKVQS